MNFSLRYVSFQQEKKNHTYSKNKKYSACRIWFIHRTKRVHIDRYNIDDPQEETHTDIYVHNLYVALRMNNIENPGKSPIDLCTAVYTHNTLGVPLNFIFLFFGLNSLGKRYQK